MIFVYTAREKGGVVRKGLIEAASVDQAAEVLRGRDLIPTEVKVKRNIGINSWFDRVRGVSSGELSVFTRQLATMINAGLPLARALEILISQTSNPRFNEILSSALRDIRSGTSLSATLEKNPSVFDSVYVSLVKAGEAAGALDKILLRLAEDQERRHEFSGRTKGAMIYPIIVVSGIVVVFVIMMVYVVPKLTTMYADLGAELPLPTRITIGISHFMTSTFWLLIILAIAGVVGVAQANRTYYGKHLIARFLIRVPVFGKISVQTQLTEFTRTMALLVQNGVPIMQALDISKGSVSNVLYTDAIVRVTSLVEKGTPFSSAIQSEPIFPLSLGQMTAVGEETGKLDEVLFKIAAYFESDVDQKVRNLNAALEPFIMIVLGVMVGFLILSIILPIYTLTTKIG